MRIYTLTKWCLSARYGFSHATKLCSFLDLLSSVALWPVSISRKTTQSLIDINFHCQMSCKRKIKVACVWINFKENHPVTLLIHHSHGRLEWLDSDSKGEKGLAKGLPGGTQSTKWLGDHSSAIHRWYSYFLWSSERENVNSKSYIHHLWSSLWITHQLG